MKTIFDVAEEAGVSVVTVSRLMNNPAIVSSKTAEKIFQAMDKLNYQPSQIARSLVGKKMNTIGVIMPDIKNTFFNNWFRFIEERASAHNINLVLCNTDDDPVKELKYIKLLHSQRVDGVIAAPYSKKNVEYLIKSNMCFILFDRIFSDLNVNFVTTDHYAGAFEAVEYLIHLGHKKIAVLKGPGILYADVQRYAAFVDAMNKHHLKMEKESVINCDFSEELALKATKELMKRKEKPTAIFTFSGLLTKGVIKCAHELHFSIPNDISLIGFDEMQGQDIYSPKITHILQSINILGKDIILAIIDMIKNPDTKKQTKLFIKPQLVIGESVKHLV